MQNNVKKHQIIINHDRLDLNEGVTEGLAFGFLNQNLETVMPISPCKDYLNDVVFCERYGGDIEAWGLNYSKQNIFDKWAWLAVTVESDKFEENLLNKNYKKVQRLFNSLEKDMGFKRTIIKKTSENLYLVKLDPRWCNQNYLISLYTLLFRNALEYEPKLDAWDFIKKGHRDEDVCYFTDKDFKSILLNRPYLDISNTPRGIGVHGKGINRSYNAIYKLLDPKT